MLLIYFAYGSQKKTVNQKLNYLKVEIELRNQQTIEIALNAK